MSTELLNNQSLIIALITGITTGLLSIVGSWLVLKSRFKREKKRDQNDRLRNILKDYLENFLLLRFHINNFRNLFQSEQYYDGFEERVKDRVEELDKMQIKVDLTASLLFIYNIESYKNNIEDHVEKIQNALDNFPSKIDFNDKNKTIQAFSDLDIFLAKEYHSIEIATRKIYPK